MKKPIATVIALVISWSGVYASEDVSSDSESTTKMSSEIVDVQQDEQLESLTLQMEEKWGEIDELAQKMSELVESKAVTSSDAFEAFDESIDWYNRSVGLMVDQWTQMLDALAKTSVAAHPQHFSGHTVLHSSDFSRPKVELGLTVTGTRGGVRVDAVDPNSGSAEGGVTPGDVIVAINGADISNVGQPAKLLVLETMRTKPGEPINLTLKRDGKTEEAVVVATEVRPNHEIVSVAGSIPMSTPRIGMGLTLTDSNGGATVKAVDPNSGSAEAGVTAGDVIVAVNGADISNARQPAKSLVFESMRTKPGEPIVLTLQRDGNTEEVSVVTSPVPPNHEIVTLTGSIPRYTPMASHYFSNLAQGSGSIQMIDLDEDLGSYFGTENGALIVDPGNSEKFKSGDVLVTIGCIDVQDQSHALQLLSAIRDETDVEIRRNRRTQSITLDKDDVVVSGPGIINRYFRALERQPPVTGRGN